MSYKTEPRIVWTEVEKKKLAFAVYYYIKTNPNSTKLQAINSVQNTVLFSHRIRKIYSYTAVANWLDEELELLDSSNIEITAKIELAKIPSETIINELFNRFENTVNNNIKSALHDIEHKIENKILSRITELEKVLVDLSTNNKSTDIIKSQEKKHNSKKKKILIAGLLHNQFNEIKHEYSEYFDLKNASGDCSIPKLKSMLTYTDHILVMTNFISHSVDGVISNSGNRYIRITGGMTSLKEEIEKLI